MAGSAMVLDECRPLWHGVEAADSIVLNPHKWLGAIFDCSLYLVRDPEHLVRVMSTNPTYLQSQTVAAVTTYRDWGIPLGRRFRALKLWTLIHLEGVAAIRARIRRDLDHARWLADAVAATPGWRLVAPVPLQTVCLRHEPPGLEGEALDTHTRAWCDRVNASGLAYLTAAVLDGRWMVRVAMGAPTTERRHVEETWRAMQAAAGGA
jgi:aromatic-L-amino-acid decarboxylase